MATHGSPELDEDACKLEALGADPGPTIEDMDSFDTYNAGFAFEPGVGLTIYPGDADPWLSWDETVALHEWLSQKIKEMNDEPK